MVSMTMFCIQLVWVIIAVNSNTLATLSLLMSSGSYLTLSVYKRYYAKSVLNRTLVRTHCSGLHLKLQDFPVALLSSL